LHARADKFSTAETSLSRRLAEFKRRAIVYEDLRAENQLIKTDLRNMAQLVAHREQRANEVGRGWVTLSGRSPKCPPTDGIGAAGP